jgi:hypothetical protein
VSDYIVRGGKCGTDANFVLERALKEFRKKLEKVVSTLYDNELMERVYEKNYNLIRLGIAFNRTKFIGPLHGSSDGHSSKVPQLVKLCHSALRDPNCFNKLKPYLEYLTKQEIASFVTALGTQDIDGKDKVRMLTLL